MGGWVSFEKQQQVSSSLTQNMKQINDLINKQSIWKRGSISGQWSVSGVPLHWKHVNRRMNTWELFHCSKQWQIHGANRHTKMQLHCMRKIITLLIYKYALTPPKCQVQSNLNQWKFSFSVESVTTHPFFLSFVFYDNFTITKLQFPTQPKQFLFTIYSKSLDFFFYRDIVVHKRVAFISTVGPT